MNWIFQKKFLEYLLRNFKLILAQPASDSSQTQMQTQMQMQMLPVNTSHKPVSFLSRQKRVVLVNLVGPSGS